MEERRIEIEPDGVLYWYESLGWMLLTLNAPNEPRGVAFWATGIRDRDARDEALKIARRRLEEHP